MQKQQLAASVSNPVDNWLHVIIIALLVVSTFIAYMGVTQHEFVLYDDPDYIKDNGALRAMDFGTFAEWAFRLPTLESRQYAANYHPLTWISHFVDYKRFKLNAGDHHATSMVLHILSTVLLFLALSKMTGSVWKSGFVAALFALHPLHVESVAWAAERKDVLSTFFWMGTMLVYAHYVRKRTAYAVPLYAGVVILYLLGLLSKPMVVTLPFVLLLLDFWPLNRFSRDRKDAEPVSKIILEKVPLLVLSGLSCWVTYIAQKSGGAVDESTVLGPTVRLADAFAAYATYIGKMFYPANLAVFYPHWGDKLPTALVAGAVALMVVLTIAAIVFGRKRPYLAVGWLWYVGTLIPVIGLIQVGEQAMADRYTYVPLIGLFIAITWLVSDLATPRRQPAKTSPGRKSQPAPSPIFGPAAWLAAPAGVVLIVLLAMTYVQVGYWHDSVKLFQHAIDTNPDNYLAYNNLGGAIDLGGDTAGAEQYVRKALEINPTYARAHNTLGNILCKLGRYQEAKEHYEQSISVTKNDYIALNNLGIVWGQSADPRDPQGYIKHGQMAEQYIRQSLSISPDFKNAYNNLGLALNMQGKSKEAIEAYETAIAKDPVYENPRTNLGELFLKLGRYPEAEEQLRNAISINSANPQTHADLARCLLAQHRTGEAKQEEAEANRYGRRMASPSVRP